MPDRLSKLRIVDPVLTELARGYSNAELIADALFPVALMSKEGGKIPQFGKEAFKIYNTERALRARSNRANPDDVDTIDVVLAEHDFEYPIDYREDDEAMFDLEQHAAITASSVIDLRREKKAADLAQNAANYAASNKVTLAGTDQFSDYANSDPVAVIEEGKEAIRSKIGRKPNVMTLGASTFSMLKEHPKLIEKIKYSMKGVLTVEMLQEIFGIPKIRVGEAVYSDDAGNFSDVWADNIVMAFVPGQQASQPRDARTPYEPSFAYTLRKRGQPVVDKYDDPGGKIRVVRKTDIFDTKIVGAEAGYLIKDTNA